MLCRRDQEDHVAFQGTDIEAANTALASVIDGCGGAPDLIAAACPLLPFAGAFCVVNRPGQRPHYLADTYPAGAAKDAVQLYVASTYLLNPVYNAILDGVHPGLYRMADLAPDNWNPAPETPGILVEDGEEIGHITSGGFSPCLKKNIAMGYVKKGYQKSGTELKVEVRKRVSDAVVTKMPFVPAKYYRP